jgi:hypothetical protein
MVGKTFVMLPMREIVSMVNGARVLSSMKPKDKFATS